MLLGEAVGTAELKLALLTLASFTRPGRKIKSLPNFLHNQKAQNFENLCNVRRWLLQVVRNVKRKVEKIMEQLKRLLNLAKPC